MDPEYILSGAWSAHRGAEGLEALGGSGGMLSWKIFKNRCSKIHIRCILRTKMETFCFLNTNQKLVIFPQINSFEVTIWFKLHKFPRKFNFGLSTKEFKMYIDKTLSPIYPLFVHCSLYPSINSSGRLKKSGCLILAIISLASQSNVVLTTQNDCFDYWFNFFRFSATWARTTWSSCWLIGTVCPCWTCIKFCMARTLDCGFGTFHCSGSSVLNLPLSRTSWELEKGGSVWKHFCHTAFRN